MNPSTVAFVPVPGAPELVIILFILLIYVAVPFLIVVAALWFYHRVRGSGDERAQRRIEALEREVESLKQEREQ
ncbi:hypothetical protein [Natronobiforma cellulositropha]|uniref:hypothetical protein n=1 Tax=Natronobiforma cellulositropha TaxID=1679076 RepID=UPI0021D61094|nr:hypothetical protein [Natronobiforma cellulositropha]